MPRKPKIKDQHINFTLKLQGDKIACGMAFYPPIAKSEDEFNALPIDQRKLNNMAQDIGRVVQQAFMELQK